MVLNHRFVSPKADGADQSQVRPSNWNDTHIINTPASGLLGTVTGGTSAEIQVVTLGSGLQFSGGTLIATASGSGGGVSTSGSVSAGQAAVFTSSSTISGFTGTGVLYAAGGVLTTTTVGNVSAATSLTSGNIVIGQSGSAVKVSGAIASASGDVTVRGLTTTGSLTVSGGSISVVGGGGVNALYTQATSYLVNNGGYFGGEGTSGASYTITAYNISSGSNVDFITLTDGNTPTCDLASSVTKSGKTILTTSGAVSAGQVAVFTNSSVASGLTGTGFLYATSGVVSTSSLLSTAVTNGTISTSIVWDGTGPTGASSLTYAYQQIGSMCNLMMRLEYAVAGTGNTQVAIELPNGVAQPAEPSGTANNEVMWAGVGQGYTSNMTGNGASAKAAIFKDTSLTNVYKLTLKGMTSGNYVGCVVSVTYPTTSGI